MPWLFEVPNKSENLSESSQHRWTSKVPVVSAILSKPSHSASLRKGCWSMQNFSVPGDVAADNETIKHPKTPVHFDDGLNIIDALAL